MFIKSKKLKLIKYVDFSAELNNNSNNGNKLAIETSHKKR